MNSHMYSFITGIPGMQPLSLGGGPRVQLNSCYDPQRSQKEDYSAMAMPSSALCAAVEGDLLEEENGGRLLVLSDQIFGT